MGTTERITNRKFSTIDMDFVRAQLAVNLEGILRANKHNVEDFTRQASKFRNGKGIVFAEYERQKKAEAKQ